MNRMDRTKRREMAAGTVRGALYQYPIILALLAFGSLAASAIVSAKLVALVTPGR